MKELNVLLNDITKLTLKIEQDFPELYQHLDENPVTLTGGNAKITHDALKYYLESLRTQLNHYIEEHEQKRSAIG